MCTVVRLFVLPWKVIHYLIKFKKKKHFQAFYGPDAILIFGKIMALRYRWKKLEKIKKQIVYLTGCKKKKRTSGLGIRSKRSKGSNHYWVIISYIVLSLIYNGDRRCSADIMFLNLLLTAEYTSILETLYRCVFGPLKIAELPRKAAHAPK